jgi:hypothetical protein
MSSGMTQTLQESRKAASEVVLKKKTEQKNGKCSVFFLSDHAQAPRHPIPLRAEFPEPSLNHRMMIHLR